MTGRPIQADADLRTILTTGSVGTLPDGALLDLFERRTGDPAADRAFEALVERHGPLVLRVARGRVPTEEDAHDVFQATFWLLARRSRSIRHRDALAGWLFGVASRVAAHAAVAAARRRLRERRAALPLADSTLDPSRGDPDLAPVVQDEVRRLPAKYRVAVVLCDLEGLSHDEAARRLGCPVGTFKARLSRARSRLRARLVARGLAPTEWRSAQPRPLVVPLPLIQAARRLALTTPAAAGPPAAVASILTLAEGASRTMIFTSIPTWAAAASAALAATVTGAVLTGIGTGQDPAGPITTPAPTSTVPPAPAPAPAVRPSVAAPMTTSAPTPAPLPPFHGQAIRQALAAVEEIADPSRKITVLIQLGRAQTDGGERVAARATFRQALTLATADKSGGDAIWALAAIGAAQVQNGDRAEGQRTFDRLVALLRSLQGGDRINPFWNAIRIEQLAVGRAASQALIAAYRDFLRTDELMRELRWGPVELARSTALAGRFDEALDLVRQSPDYDRADMPFLRPEAVVAVANALLPDDPPELITATLAEARQAVLGQPDLKGGQATWKFNNLIALMNIESLLGRFDEAAELGSHFAPALPKSHLEPSMTFNKAACFDLLAEQANKAGQFDRALKSARRALDWVRDVQNPDTRSYPTTRAIAAMVVAGGADEAFQIYEATPPGLLGTEFTWDTILELRKQGKMAAAQRWAEVELARNRDQLRRIRQASPEPLLDLAETARRERLTPSEDTLNRWIAQYEALLGDSAQTRQVIASQPAAVQALILPGLARDRTRRGLVVEALALVDQTTDPTVRREIEITVATNLPTPPRPAAPQSPRSEAAR